MKGGKGAGRSGAEQEGKQQREHHGRADHRVRRVDEIDVRFGYQQWKVQTDRGPIEFRVQEREDIRFLPDGRFSVKDADGNVYFSLGGRYTQGGIFRVVYRGSAAMARSRSRPAMSTAMGCPMFILRQTIKGVTNYT